MAEVALDTSLAEQAAARALDQKLADAARKIRENRERKLRERERQPLAASVLGVVEQVPTPSRRMEPPAEAPAAPRLPDAVRHQVPLRFRGATLDNFRPDSDEQAAALHAVREWLARALGDGDAMLALIGPTGCGKSHLLYAAANALAKAQRRFYARPWYVLADELRYGGVSSFSPDKRLEPDEVRAQLRGERIVFMDEVRPTAATAFDDTELAKFACLAYDNQLAVMITSNVFPLADVMGPPAASRFVQVIVKGADARQTR